MPPGFGEPGGQVPAVGHRVGAHPVAGVERADDVAGAFACSSLVPPMAEAGTPLPSMARSRPAGTAGSASSSRRRVPSAARAGRAGLG
jgi:hypothetical protein